MIGAAFLATMLAAVPVIGNLADIRTNDVTIVVEEGTHAARAARAAFPDRRIIECVNIHDGVMSVEGGKADVLVYDLPYLEPAAMNRPAVRILDEHLGKNCIAVGAPFRNTALMEKVNAFIRQFRADGTYDEMYRRWMQTANPVMPCIPEAANPEGTVRIGVTLEITFIAALLGTILAFPLWLALISPIRPLRLLGRSWVEVMQGTPVLVMLMIVFYVTFANIDISPVLVAILVFGTNFSAYVGEIIGAGVSAIPHGQWEAAYALGYSKFGAFRKFVFPQALRISLPVYRGMLISMLKETSVVGYITIHDQTKVCDLVRARTYDGFSRLSRPRSSILHWPS